MAEGKTFTPHISKQARADLCQSRTQLVFTNLSKQKKKISIFQLQIGASVTRSGCKIMEGKQARKNKGVLNAILY